MLTQELDLQTKVNMLSDGGAAEIGHGRDALSPVMNDLAPWQAEARGAAPQDRHLALRREETMGSWWVIG